MDNFITWFFNMMHQFFGGLADAVVGFFSGLGRMVNIFEYWGYYKFEETPNLIEWILIIVVSLLLVVFFAAIVYLVVLGILKLVRYMQVVNSNEDMLREISDLHRDIAKLNNEKERLMSMKVGEGNLSSDNIREIVEMVTKDYSENVDAYVGEREDEFLTEEDIANGKKRSENTPAQETKEEGGVAPSVPVDDGTGKRFFRLSAVDEKYTFYQAPEYVNDYDLEKLCDDFRNFACSRMRLYYEPKTIRLMFAGLASTKMILLQGISGTGKTSLPYAMGKFFENDATIASVQPSWRDRTELFGYFNEFTKHFNETEVLKRIYEASFNDDVNVIILDEMNIARVEYYFAEMLSILEMPNPNEWKISLVPAAWPNDPAHLVDGRLTIPQNVWYVGTANNDDSTFSVSDKVYDRAFTINLDKKGIPFEAPDTAPRHISYNYVAQLYAEAIEKRPVSQEALDKIAKLDDYVIAHFRVAFGNRIMKQLRMFVPVYVACGGSEIEAIDYLLATKVIRKFEGLNLSLIRDEIGPMIDYLDRLFGTAQMEECIAYLKRIRKMV